MSNKAVVESLNVVLADAIVFYQKLHQYHWVVEGKQFFALHAKFEELYEQYARRDRRRGGACAHGGRQAGADA